jgi:hypothetical protein
MGSPSAFQGIAERILVAIERPLTSAAAEMRRWTGAGIMKRWSDLISNLSTVGQVLGPDIRTPEYISAGPSEEGRELRPS